MGVKSSRVYPTNSQSMSLPMMGFEYVNGLPPIHKGPLRPSVGIMAHLVVNDLDLGGPPIMPPLCCMSRPKMMRTS